MKMKKKNLVEDVASSTIQPIRRCVASKANKFRVIDALLEDQAWIGKSLDSLTPFVRKITTSPKVLMYCQLPIRTDKSKINRFTRAKKQPRKVDIAGVISPYDGAYGSDLITFVIEIKTSLADFRRDEKWHEFLGYTDLFFFYLDLPFDRQAINHLPCGVGVLRSNGELFISPRRQQVSPENNLAFYRQMTLAHLYHSGGFSDIPT